MRRRWLGLVVLGFVVVACGAVGTNQFFHMDKTARPELAAWPSETNAALADTTLAQDRQAASQDIALTDCTGKSLQALIDAAPAGSTLQPPACIYHQTVTISKPLVLDGQGQTQIRGSDVWTDWSSSKQGYVSKQTVPTFDTQHQGQCMDGSGKCNWPEQVFSDGTPLTEMAQGSTPGGGQFALDSSRHVILGQDPHGHVIEVATRTQWIDVESDNVTIKGMTFWHAANAAETGAIGNQNHAGFTLQSNAMYDAHGGIVSLGGGTNSNVIGNIIAGSGYEAINGYKNDSTLIASNVIYDNNLAGFDWVNWAGAGIKLVSFTNLTIHGNEVRNNHGPGIWCDIDCQNVEISGNRVHDNQGAGILFEISSGATIYQNAVWHSGQDWPGISVSTSNNANVSGNLLAWNSQGVYVFAVARNDAPPGGTGGNDVHDNTVVDVGQTSPVLSGWQIPGG